MNTQSLLCDTHRVPVPGVDWPNVRERSLRSDEALAPEAASRDGGMLMLTLSGLLLGPAEACGGLSRWDVRRPLAGAAAAAAIRSLRGTKLARTTGQYGGIVLRNARA